MIWSGILSLKNHVIFYMEFQFPVNELKNSFLATKGEPQKIFRLTAPHLRQDKKTRVETIFSQFLF